MMVACPPHCPAPLPMTTPPLPTTPTQRSRQKMRERCLFRNNGWTKWEAVQLADELEVKQEMEKAGWECWTKLETQFEQIHGPFLFDMDDTMWIKMRG
jgi:hypothetical protein